MVFLIISRIVTGLDAIIDINGIYGMTQHSIGIEIDNIEEAKKIKNVIDSDKFREVLD